MASAASEDDVQVVVAEESGNDMKGSDEDVKTSDEGDVKTGEGGDVKTSDEGDVKTSDEGDVKTSDEGGGDGNGGVDGDDKDSQPKVSFADPVDSWDGHNPEGYLRSHRKTKYKKMRYVEILVDIVKLGLEKKTNKDFVNKAIPDLISISGEVLYGRNTQHDVLCRDLGKSFRTILSSSNKSFESNLSNWSKVATCIVELVSLEKKSKKFDRRQLATDLVRFVTILAGIDARTSMMIFIVANSAIDALVFGKNQIKWRHMSWIRKLLCACLTSVPNMSK